MHHTTPVLRELVLVAALALAVSLVFRRLRIPAVSGFILLGALVGPGALGLVSDAGTVNTLAGIGVVLLMFTVGLEFSLTDLRASGLRPLVAGVLQIALTTTLTAAILVAAGAHAARAVFFGLLVSLSSTALLLKLLADRAEMQAPHGRLVIGTLLLQDVALVPFALLTPALADWLHGRMSAGIELPGVLRALGISAATALVLIVARRAVPWTLRRAVRSREAFLAAIVLVVTGAAWLSEMAGLPIAIGAFLAGLLLSRSEESSQIAADVLPFRDTLSSVFFISVGMLFSPAQIAKTPLLVAGATLGLVAVKFVAAAAAMRLARQSWPVALSAGFALAHVGEFSFVLAQEGTGVGLLPEPWGQSFLAAAAFSIVIAPWLAEHATRWSVRLDHRFGLSRTAGAAPAAEPVEPGLAHHVVIAGFGLNGRNVARVLRAVHVPHVVVDQASDRIAACVAEGSRAFIGNATQNEILHRAGMAKARALVVALSEPIATRHVVRLSRAMNRHLFIIVRTRYVHEVDGFYEAGANVVIPEEFETSIEIFTAVLRQFHVPHNIVEAQTSLLRRERYSILRGRRLPGSVIEQIDVLLAEGTTETALVLQHSPAVGASLGDLALLEDGPGCRAVAVVRGGHAITDLDRGFRLHTGDTLVLVGSHAQIDSALERLNPPEAESGV